MKPEISVDATMHFGEAVSEPSCGGRSTLLAICQVLTGREIAPIDLPLELGVLQGKATKLFERFKGILGLARTRWNKSTGARERAAHSTRQINPVEGAMIGANDPGFEFEFAKAVVEDMGPAGLREFSKQSLMLKQHLRPKLELAADYLADRSRCGELHPSGFPAHPRLPVAVQLERKAIPATTWVAGTRLTLCGNVEQVGAGVRHVWTAFDSRELDAAIPAGGVKNFEVTYRQASWPLTTNIPATARAFHPLRKLIMARARSDFARDGSPKTYSGYARKILDELAEQGQCPDVLPEADTVRKWLAAAFPKSKR